MQLFSPPKMILFLPTYCLHWDHAKQQNKTLQSITCTTRSFPPSNASWNMDYMLHLYTVHDCPLFRLYARSTPLHLRTAERVDTIRYGKAFLYYTNFLVVSLIDMAANWLTIHNFYVSNGSSWCTMLTSSFYGIPN